MSPTEPGWYWVLHGGVWQPAHVQTWVFLASGKEVGMRYFIQEYCADAHVLSEAQEWGPRIYPPDAPVTREQVEKHIDAMSGVNSVTRGQPYAFGGPPPPGAREMDDKLAQLVTNVARERGRRIERAVLAIMEQGRKVERLDIHMDGGGIEQRCELIVAGEVAETVDLSDLAPERLMRDSGKER